MSLSLGSRQNALPRVTMGKRRQVNDNEQHVKEKIRGLLCIMSDVVELPGAHRPVQLIIPPTPVPFASMINIPPRITPGSVPVDMSLYCWSKIKACLNLILKDHLMFGTQAPNMVRLPYYASRCGKVRRGVTSRS